MTRDQFLCEEVMGEKWPRYNEVSGMKEYPYFSAWPDKGRLMDKVMEEDDWEEFREWAWDKWVVLCAADDSPCEVDFTKYLLTNFADLVAEFRGWAP